MVPQVTEQLCAVLEVALKRKTKVRVDPGEMRLVDGVDHRWRVAAHENREYPRIGYRTARSTARLRPCRRRATPSSSAVQSRRHARRD